MNIIEYENYREIPEPDYSAFPYRTYPCTIPLDFKKVPLHWHDEMEFIYIKKGKGLITVDFDTYKVEAKDIVIVCPGQLHSIEQWHEVSMEYENIIFDLNLLTSRQPDICWVNYLSPMKHRQIRLPILITEKLPFYNQVAACLDCIDEVRQSFPESFELLIKGKLYELFFLLYSNQIKDFGNLKVSKQPKSLEKIRLVIKYVEQHYSEPLSIKEISEVCAMSQSHFMKFVKQTMGMPFTAYLNDYRLTMASRLLLSSEESILDIAGNAGYNNLSYFNRVFKKKFDMTPREFRRRMDILS